MVQPHEGQVGGGHSPPELHLGHEGPPGHQRAPGRVRAQPPAGAAPGGDHLAAGPGFRPGHLAAALAPQPGRLRRRGPGLGPLPAPSVPAIPGRSWPSASRTSTTRWPPACASWCTRTSWVTGSWAWWPATWSGRTASHNEPQAVALVEHVCGPRHGRARARAAGRARRACRTAAAVGVSDRIEIRDLRVLGVHGVLPEERERAQPFSLDIVAWVDIDGGPAERRPGRHGRLRGAGPAAADVVAGRSFQLLEALAGRLADALLVADPRLEAVEVTVRKLRPPLALDVASTGVRVRAQSLMATPWRRAFLGLGSNLGDRRGPPAPAPWPSLRAGGDVVAVSPLYETEPVGGPGRPGSLPQPGGRAGHDRLAPPPARRCQALEAAAHRVRTVRLGPRTLDADVLCWRASRSTSPT